MGQTVGPDVGAGPDIVSGSGLTGWLGAHSVADGEARPATKRQKRVESSFWTASDNRKDPLAHPWATQVDPI